MGNKIPWRPVDAEFPEYEGIKITMVASWDDSIFWSAKCYSVDDAIAQLGSLERGALKEHIERRELEKLGNNVEEVPNPNPEKEEISEQDLPF